MLEQIETITKNVLAIEVIDGFTETDECFGKIRRDENQSQ